MNSIILKIPLKSKLGVKLEVFGWYELAYGEWFAKDEKAEEILVNIPIKKAKIKPKPHSTTANMLPKYIEKFGKTYDLSSHPKYPTKIPAKNTENTTVNII